MQESTDQRNVLPCADSAPNLEDFKPERERSWHGESKQSSPPDKGSLGPSAVTNSIFHKPEQLFQQLDESLS